MKKKSNLNSVNYIIEDITKVIVLIAAAFVFTYSVLSKKALLYVHVRHLEIIIFAAAVFLIIGFFHIKRLCFFRNREIGNHSFPLYLFIFICPLFLSVIASHKPLSLDSLAFNLDLSAQGHNPIQRPSAPFKLLELENGFIVMDDDSFGRWLPELYLNLDSWVDKKIKIEGAIWKNPEMFGETQFAIGRMMMVCCAADMQPIGVIAQWENAPAVKDDEWVRITGKVSEIEYEGEKEPLVIVESIETINRPQLEYVYPF